LWNEPDISYWKGTMEQFFKLYDYTEAAVHKALEHARLGGPTTTGPSAGGRSLEFLNAFLAHCAGGTNYFSGQKGTRLDFVSFHAKGGGFSFDLRPKKQTPSLRSFLRQVKLGLDTVKAHGYGHLEVVLSEADPDGWAAGGAYDNKNMNFRNTEYYATYVAAAYHGIAALARQRGMNVRPLAWAFLFVGERCFEGTRTFRTRGIDKAVFNLFKLYARLDGGALAFSSSGERDVLKDRDDFGTGEMPLVSGMAASDGRAVRVLIFSHHDDWDVKTPQRIALTVKNLKASCVSLRHFRIDAQYSNAYAEWVRQGSPKYPAGAQYDTIKARDGLELIEPERTVRVENGTLEAEFDFPSHAVSLLEIIN